MWFTIIDYAGTTKHFYDPEFDGDPQFIELDNLNDTNEWAPGEEPAESPGPGCIARRFRIDKLVSGQR